MISSQSTSQNVIYKLKFSSDSTITRPELSTSQRSVQRRAGHSAASLSGSPRPHPLTSGTINQNKADEEKVSSFLLSSVP